MNVNNQSLSTNSRKKNKCNVNDIGKRLFIVKEMSVLLYACSCTRQHLFPNNTNWKPMQRCNWVGNSNGCEQRHKKSNASLCYRQDERGRMLSTLNDIHFLIKEKDVHTLIIIMFVEKLKLKLIYLFVSVLFLCV